jgi:hypothetical protein
MADAFSDNWAEDFYGDLARSIIDNNETNWPESVIYYDLGLEPLPKVA